MVFGGMRARTAALWLVSGMIGAAGAAGFATSAGAQQPVQCCSRDTGAFSTEMSEEACLSRPDGVLVDPLNPSSYQVCVQAIQGAVQGGTLGDYMSGLPGMGGMNIPGLTPAGGEQMRCCDTGARAWTGPMTAEACLAEPGRYPDTPDYVEQTQMCRPQQSAGGGQAWDVEDYEENIPNGGFEQWRNDSTPLNFGSYSTGSMIPQAAPGQPQFNFQTVFQDPDAHTGQYSVRLKNKSVREAMVDNGLRADMVPPNMGLPAGIITCRDSNCPRDGSGGIEQMIIPVEEVKDYLCAAYKGFIAGQDEVAVNVVLTQNGQPRPAGINAAAPNMYLRESAAEWTTFVIPVGGLMDISTADEAIVQLQVQPRLNLGMIQATGMTTGVSATTDVKLDSVHFCSPVDLEIYMPKVIAENTTTAVSEREETTLGAQTFVNLDNDDKDGFFDNQDEDGVEGDNELVRIRMELPRQSRGEAAIQVAGVGERIALWSDADKKEKFDEANDFIDVSKLMKEEDGKLVRELWVEALQASQSVGDIDIKFVFRSEAGTSDKEDRVVLTALGIEEIVWKGRENSFDNSNELDEDPNFPARRTVKGVRVFPGKRVINGKVTGGRRDIVDVEVTLNVDPPRPVDFVFRAFDVDDPNETLNDVDDESEWEDNRGEGFRSWGEFVGHELEYLRVEFTKKTATFPFRVTMQPGDNVRLVGGGDVMTLFELHNRDFDIVARSIGEGGDIVVDEHVFEREKVAPFAEVREPEKYASDVLTVWRFLYIERDRMEPVKDNHVEGTIVGVAQVPSTAGDATVLGISRNLASVHPTAKGTAGVVNQYKGGRIDIEGFGSYEVYSNTAHQTGGDNVNVLGLLPEEMAGATFHMVDDDYKLDFDDGEYIPWPPLDRVGPAFEPAYIALSPEEPDNPVKMAPYVPNLYNDTSQEIVKLFEFDNIAYDDDPDVWIVYLLGAHQGVTTEDGDGENAVASGETGFQTGALIYMEGARERIGGRNIMTTSSGLGVADAVAHEIGHMFTAAHGDRGLMDQKDDDFSSESRAKIRSVEHP